MSIVLVYSPTPWRKEPNSDGYVVRDCNGEWLFSSDRYEASAPNSDDADAIVQAINTYGRMKQALLDIEMAHPAGASWSTMNDGTWREACRELQRIARVALNNAEDQP